MRGDADGLAEMFDGLARAGQTGSQNAAPPMLGMLADAQCQVGQLTDAQTRREPFNVVLLKP